MLHSSEPHIYKHTNITDTGTLSSMMIHANTHGRLWRALSAGCRGRNLTQGNHRYVIDRLAVTAAAIRITLHVLVALRRRASYTYGMHG